MPSRRAIEDRTCSASSLSPSISLLLRTSAVRVWRTASCWSLKPSDSMRPISRPCRWRTEASCSARRSESQRNLGQSSSSWIYILRSLCGYYRPFSPQEQVSPQMMRRLQASISAAPGLTDCCNGTQGFSGDGGAATSASLYYPVGVAVDGSGNLFIADTQNHRVRQVDATGVITTVAGNGTLWFSGDGGAATSASLFYPSGVALDGSGNLFIADGGNQRVRRVDAAAGVITTVA